jgi:hypothetical protein
MARAPLNPLGGRTPPSGELGGVDFRRASRVRAARAQTEARRGDADFDARDLWGFPEREDDRKDDRGRGRDEGRERPRGKRRGTRRTQHRKPRRAGRASK